MEPKDSNYLQMKCIDENRNSQNRSDLLKLFQDRGFLGSGASSFAFLPRIGLSSFFRILWKPPEPRPSRRRRPWLTWWATRGWMTGATPMRREWEWDLGTDGSERLRGSMARFRWVWKDIRSKWSSRLLCSSPNRFRISAISSICGCVCVCALKWGIGSLKA